MRKTKSLKKTATILAIVTPFLLLPLVTLHGCGDDLEDECEDACNKVAECGDAINLDVNYDLCVSECLDGPPGARDCALNCDRGLSCADYGLCIVGCGFTDEEDAVETNCRNACTRLDECANDLGLDVSISECTNDCIAEDQSTQGCIFNCDTGDNCVEYGACVLPCGIQ